MIHYIHGKEKNNNLHATILDLIASDKKTPLK